MADDTTGSVDTTGNPSQTTTDTPPPAKWYSTVGDDTLRGLADNKGWDTPDKVLTSYRNLEQHMGVPPERLIKLPEKADDPAWGDIHKRLGFAAPEKAEDYAFKAPDGADGSLLGKFAEKMLGRKVPAGMAQGLVEDFYSIQGEAATAADLALKAANDREVMELKAEWGAESDRLQQQAERAMNEFGKKAGLTQDHMDILKDALGPKAFGKLFAEIGASTGEAKFVDGKANPAGSMTVEGARARLEQLGNDSAWFARFNAGDLIARQEYQTLRDIVARASVS